MGKKKGKIRFIVTQYLNTHVYLVSFGNIIIGGWKLCFKVITVLFIIVLWKSIFGSTLEYLNNFFA